MLHMARRIHPILIISGIFLLASCTRPLERKYNSETFADDLSKLNKTDRFIIKNVINAYQKNKDADNIAGSETVLIPSLTFKQIKTNYLAFDEVFRESEKEKLKDDLRSKWAKRFDKDIFKDNISLIWGKTLNKVPEFDTWYYKRVVIVNNFNDSLTFSGIINVNDSKKEWVLGYDLLENSNFLESGEGVPKKIYVPYPMEKYRYGSRKNLKISGFSYDFIFVINRRKYNFKSYAFLDKFAPPKIKKEIAQNLNKVDIMTDSLFSPTVWPYDANQVSILEGNILNKCDLQ